MPGCFLSRVVIDGRRATHLQVTSRRHDTVRGSLSSSDYTSLIVLIPNHLGELVSLSSPLFEDRVVLRVSCNSDSLRSNFSLALPDLA